MPLVINGLRGGHTHLHTDSRQNQCLETRCVPCLNSLQIHYYIHHLVWDY